jgi:Cytochrome c7 and related cytochrome c/Class III cytochrome C family
MRSVPKKYAIREEDSRRSTFCKKIDCLVLLLGLVSAAAFVATLESSITTMAQERTPKDVSPPLAKSPAEQPIPFSHKLHLTFDMKCQECHPNPEPGDRMTLPAADRCMECHRTVVKEKPAIQKLAEFAKSKQTIPWVRIYVVSGSVFWNHRSHREAGMKCEACHGEVRKMDVLSATTDVTTMAGCVDCHRKNDASTGCQYCHAGR